MAAYPKPTGNSGTFNNQSFNNPDNAGGLTVEEGLKYFVSYPVTQSPSNITANNFTTTGFLNVAGTSQFGGDATFIGGATITGPLSFSDNIIVEGTVTVDQALLALTTAEIDGELTVNNNIILDYDPAFPTIKTYIQFSDNTIQDTAFIEANYAQLNTANEFLTGFTQTFSGPVILNGNTTLGTGLNMNTNSISGVNIVSSNSLTLTSPVLPLVAGNNTGMGQTVGLMYINNNTPYVNNPSFSFALQGASGFQSILNLTPDGSALNSSLDMTNFGITSCSSINATTGNYITTISPPDGDNTTKIATTAWVTANSASPVLTNYAQLTYPTLQTFTGSMFFSGTVNFSTVNTVNSAILSGATLQGSCRGFTQTFGSNTTELATTAFVANATPINTLGIGLSVYTVTDPGRCTFPSAALQETQQTNSTGTAYASFFSSPFVFNTVNVGGVPVAGSSSGITPLTNPILVLQLSKLPWPNAFGSTPATGWFTLIGSSTNSSGTTSVSIPCAFASTGASPSGITLLYIGSAYNVGNGCSVTVTLASLGLFAS